MSTTTTEARVRYTLRAVADGPASINPGHVIEGAYREAESRAVLYLSERCRRDGEAIGKADARAFVQHISELLQGLPECEVCKAAPATVRCSASDATEATVRCTSCARSAVDYEPLVTGDGRHGWVVTAQHLDTGCAVCGTEDVGRMEPGAATCIDCQHDAEVAPAAEEEVGGEGSPADAEDEWTPAAFWQQMVWSYGSNGCLSDEQLAEIAQRHGGDYVNTGGGLMVACLPLPGRDAEHVVALSDEGICLYRQEGANAAERFADSGDPVLAHSIEPTEPRPTEPRPTGAVQDHALLTTTEGHRVTVELKHADEGIVLTVAANVSLNGVEPGMYLLGDVEQG